MKKEYKLQDDYIGLRISEVLAINYDENQLLVEEFSDKIGRPKKESVPNVK
ncbi:MAG: hypothetical protein ACRC76_06675 [Proteocatella sp.]